MLYPLSLSVGKAQEDEDTAVKQISCNWALVRVKDETTKRCDLGKNLESFLDGALAIYRSDIPDS